MAGKKWSAERKAAFSQHMKELWQQGSYRERQVRRRLTADHCRKISRGQKGHKVSAATRARISAALTGKKNPGQSERAKALWERPGFRKKMIAMHRGKVSNPKALAALHRRQRGSNHPRWKRGWTISHGGYRLLSVGGRQVREHRLVMERLLGRKLKRSEVVHHRNGDRLDNRPENLELVRSQSKHMEKLQRHRCPWCGTVTTRVPKSWPRKTE